jgi:hypothetical protein
MGDSYLALDGGSLPLQALVPNMVRCPLMALTPHSENKRISLALR